MRNIAVRLLDSAVLAGYNAGEVAGFREDVARRLVENGYAVYVDPPAEPAPEPEAAPEEAQPKPKRGRKTRK